MNTSVSVEFTLVLEKCINIGMNIDMIAAYILLTFSIVFEKFVTS